MGRGRSKAGGSGGGGRSSLVKTEESMNGKPNDATEYYVSGDGMWINQYLRGRGDFGELSDSERQYLHDLDVATNGKITEDTLYRNVDAEAIFGSLSDMDGDNLMQALRYGMDSFGKGKYADGVREDVQSIIDKTVGKTITEKGFMSTTTSKQVAEDWEGFTGSTRPVVLKISTSSNTKGVNLSSYDKNATEPQYERLLARGQSYTVQRIYAEDNTVFIDVKMK